MSDLDRLIETLTREIDAYRAYMNATGAVENGEIRRSREILTLAREIAAKPVTFCGEIDTLPQPDRELVARMILRERDGGAP